MKYKTFRNLIATGVVLAATATVGTCVMCSRDTANERAEVAPRPTREAAPRTPEGASGAATAGASVAALAAQAPGLSESDRDVLAALQRPVVDKIKDATKGKPYKANVYSDDGARFNRVKLDLDRDEKWDESWTVKADGTIEKKVAANDDEKYGPALRLDVRSGWIDATAAAVPAPVPPPATSPTPPAAASASGGSGLSAADLDVLALVKARAPTAKIKDATKGKPYKVNLYSDDGSRWSRAKVDLDRDDKWDESWTFKPGGAVEKKVAPADDDNYTVTRAMSGDRWAP